MPVLAILLLRYNERNDWNHQVAVKVEVTVMVEVESGVMADGLRQPSRPITHCMYVLPRGVEI